VVPSVSQLPEELASMFEAIDIVSCRVSEAEGWKPHGYPAASRRPVIPGAPPYDGVYRGSWISPGICVRLDLTHPSVPSRVSAGLRERFPSQVGTDDAFYEYGIAASSQRTNRDDALLALALAVAEVRSP
jgi:hypothetical protein